MEKLTMCRVCLVEGVRMHVIGKSQLYKTYEALTSSPFETRDARPIQVCYICYARLKNCHRLMECCLRSEKLFTQMINNKMLKIKRKSSHHGLTLGPVIHTTVGLDSCEDVPNRNLEDAVSKYLIEEKNTNSEADPKSQINVDCIKKEPLDVSSDIQKEQTDIINYDNVNIHKTHELCIDIIKEETHDASDSDSESPIEETENILVQPDVSWIKNKQGSDWSSNNHSQQNSEVVKKKPGNLQITQPVLQNTTLSTPCTKKRPFECYACHKKFTRKEYLRSHLCNNVRGPYKCDICEKGFNRKDILNKHILIHSGEKPYQCDICKKSFQQKSYLNTHIRTHTGENPFPCSVCLKEFNSTSNLKRHFRTHTGEKPHQCEICDKSFICKGDLIKHNRKHTGEKPFQCDICKKYFSTNAYVKKHHIRAHCSEAISV